MPYNYYMLYVFYPVSKYQYLLLNNEFQLHKGIRL